MAVFLSPVGGVAAQFFTNTGAVLTGGKIYTYLAGTTTPAVTYTSSSGAVAQPNPIVLDAAGRVPNSGEIWLSDGVSYKFVLKDSNDVLIATYDNIVGINSNFVNYTNQQEIQTATASQTVFTLTTMQYQPGTGSLSVFVDGVNQYGPGAQYAYIETSSTVVTFVSGLHVGASVKFTTSQFNSSSYGNSSQITYTPAGTGAVNTNVQAKLREWVSPQDFGALGDSNANGSVGTNDSAAFALLEAYQTGGVVNMNDKFYLVSSPIPTKNNYINGKFVLANGTTYDQPNNLSLGTEALYSNTFVPNVWPAGGGISYASGNYNTAYGDAAMRGNTTGRRNTAVGSLALYTNSSGYYNTAIGPLAMYSCTSGYENTAVGVQALQSNTNGHDNVAIGSGALTQGTTVNYNIAIGRQALQLASSTSNNVAIGFQAMLSYDAGGDSVGIGYQALSAPGAVGLYNIAIGSASLGQTTTGNSNVAIGRRAANATTTGAGNVALGNDAMVGSGLPCTGSNNVAIGNTAAPNIQAGYQNVAIGASAGAAISGGFSNTFVGRFAGPSVNSGSGNIAIGEQALSTTDTGNYNTAVGVGTVGGAAYTNTTLLGYQATVTGSNQVQLGNASTTTYAYGAVQNRSDARDKADVRPTVLGLDFINSLRPVDFKWDMRDDYRSAPPEPVEPSASDEEKEAHKAAVTKWVEDNKLSNLNPDGSKKRNRYHHGLIAQEVKAAITASGIDFGGLQDHSINGGQDVMSIGYEELIAPLIKAVQQLSAEVAELKAKNG